MTISTIHQQEDDRRPWRSTKRHIAYIRVGPEEEEPDATAQKMDIRDTCQVYEMDWEDVQIVVDHTDGTSVGPGLEILLQAVAQDQVDMVMVSAMNRLATTITLLERVLDDLLPDSVLVACEQGIDTRHGPTLMALCVFGASVTLAQQWDIMR